MMEAAVDGLVGERGAADESPAAGTSAAAARAAEGPETGDDNP